MIRRLNLLLQDFKVLLDLDHLVLVYFVFLPSLLLKSLLEVLVPCFELSLNRLSLLGNPLKLILHSRDPLLQLFLILSKLAFFQFMVTSLFVQEHGHGLELSL